MIGVRICWGDKGVWVGTVCVGVCGVWVCVGCVCVCVCGEAMVACEQKGWDSQILNWS